MAVLGALLVLLHELISGLVGVSAVLTGLLRVLGGFAAEKRFGRRWTIGGIVLGTVEVAFGGVLLVSSQVDPEVLGPVAAAWGVVSGSLLLVEGLRLRRLARGTRGPPSHLDEWRGG